MALGSGTLFVVGTTYGGHLLMARAAPRFEPVPALEPRSTGSPTYSPDVPANDWRAMLTSNACPTPCARGPACAAAPTTCSSGLACIPGTGHEPFASSETWMLHLSAVQETGPGGIALDPCRTGRDFWVCRSGTSNCASQRDACDHGSKSTTGIPVTGAEIAARSIVLDVHEGGPATPPLARTLPIQDLVRSGLCNGFGRAAVGGGIGRVTYFLLPP